jgi:trk system potassium uptake protein TrkH
MIRQRFDHLPPVLRIVLGLTLLVMVGSSLLLLPGIGRQTALTPGEALFTATSALTVTGLSVITPGTDLTLFGQIVLLLLIQVGGVGFMAVATILFRLLGRRIHLLNRLALQDSLGLNAPGAILRALGRVLLFALIIEGVGTILLWWHWARWFPPGQAFFMALFHAVSAYCNAGFDLFGGTRFNGIPTDTLSLGIMSGLIILGGLGMPVMSELVLERRRLSLHTRISLVMMGGLLLLGWVGLWLAESRPDGVLAGLSTGEGLMLTYFQAVAVRTAGFASLPAFHALTAASQWLLMGLMFIGTAPASMGGGITTGTLAVLVISLWSYARGVPVAQVAHRTIPPETTRRAAAILTVSLLVVGLATWLILVTHLVPLEMAMFEVVSAFATTGLSLGMTEQLNGFGRLIIILVMFWGRLGALTLIVALARTRHPQAFRYPEENLLIG